MLIIIGCSFAALFILYLAAGQIRGVDIYFDEPNDTFEQLDYRKEGRVSAPYIVWRQKDGSRTSKSLTGYIKIKYRWPLLFWGKQFGEEAALLLDYKDEDIAPFLESITLEWADNESHPRGRIANVTLHPKSRAKPDASFRIKFHRIADSAIEKPRISYFKVSCSVSSSRLLLFRAVGSALKKYRIFIGPDLGRVWLAIDPGTTATCMATATHAEQMVLPPREEGQDLEEKEGIIPSLLAINTDQQYEKVKKLADFAEKGGVKTGYEAWLQRTDTKFAYFQSIKKMLGYKDLNRIIFSNGAVLDLDGKQLTSLLVTGMIKQFREYLEVEWNGQHDSLFTHGKYRPQRVVVAVPNNFTAGKIQDVADSLAETGQFGEIRCIYEAEAVLCYYIHQHKTLHPKSTPLEDETVLVFDMGGATINITIADTFVEYEEKTPKYFVEIDGKMGYGIGGDTLDYCLAKLFWEHKDEFPQLARLDPFADMRRMSAKEKQQQRNLRNQTKQVMENLKKQIVQRAEKGMDVLIEPIQISSEFKNVFNFESFSIDSESVLYQYFKKGESGYNMMKHPLFRQYVYQPVEDAVNELAKISNLKYLDTVIFSGRTTMFPGIRESVKKRITTLTNQNIEYVQLRGDELKTAVVKGACWYAVNRNAVGLSQPKVSCHFGVRHTTSGTKGSFEFVEIISMGTDMIDNQAKGREDINSRFALDNNQVHFFQVMGSDAEAILRNGERHKYSSLGTIDVDSKVKSVSMELVHDDRVKGNVMMDNGSEEPLNTTAKDQEIGDANDEHYTWIVN